MKNVVGNIYNGEIVLKDQNSYLVDLGIGFDAILNFDEAEKNLEVGDNVDVILTHFYKDDHFVSMKGVSKRRKIEAIEENLEEEKVIKGKVIAFKNNRFIIDMSDGVKGSVYVKNMDIKYIEDGSEYLNNDYDFIVLGRSKRGYEDFDLSRRELLVEEANQKRDSFTSKYNVGDVLKGKVINAINAGIILDMDGVECFVPRSEISHKYNDELPEVGSEFEVEIEEIQTRNLSLKGTIKKLLTHPFEKAKELKVDDIIKGKIVRKADYGLFVEIFEGVDGLVHISEVSYVHTKNLDGFEIGQEIEVKVIDVNHDKKKIGLSIKKLLPSPFQYLVQKVAVGDTINVTIKRITESGVRVMVMDNFYTTIINEDIYDFSKIKPTLKINDKLEVIIMELDEENEKIQLSNTEFVNKSYELLESSI